MKTKFLLLSVLLMCATALFAQQDVTKFMGIPVDGFKRDMIPKLEAKGFEYDEVNDCLTGEFNGEDVEIYIVTNNNKVYRIAVADKMLRDETDIRIRFNNLCYQFMKNKNYTVMSDSDQTIPEEENIGYEMIVNHKRYQANFYQNPKLPTDSIAQEAYMKEYVSKYLMERYSMSLDSIQKLPDEKKEELRLEIAQYFLKDTLIGIYDKSVWFTIHSSGPRYNLVLYYDNVCNEAHGEDL